jgi:hypothetical protein
VTDEQNARENMEVSLSLNRDLGESEKTSLERRALVWAVLGLVNELQDLRGLIDNNIANFGRGA